MIRTRFAPSPTGALHLGGVRTALYCWLYARRHGGEYVLRIEDTDRERSTEAALNTILQGMDWLGLNADQPPIFQSQRTERYRAVLNQLLDAGLAYHCYCTREELQEMREQAMARGAANNTPLPFGPYLAIAGWIALIWGETIPIFNF